jgi:hypothetical protein
MSLSIGSNLSSFTGAGAAGLSDPTARGVRSGQLSTPGGESTQSDQIDITSVTINISQTIAPSSDGQPNQNTKTGSTGGGVLALQSETSEASIALQILNDTTNTSPQGADQNSSSKATDTAANVKSTTANSVNQSINVSYLSVDISV